MRLLFQDPEHSVIKGFKRIALPDVTSTGPKSSQLSAEARGAGNRKAQHQSLTLNSTITALTN